MNFVQCDPFDLDFSLFPKRKEGEDPVRSGGLHLTDIIRSIMEASGMLKTVSGTSWKPQQLSMAAEVGFMWEDIIGMAMKDRLPNRIGELMVDGITMSPDGLELGEWQGCPDTLFLSEYKAVWSSSKRLPVDNWKWMTQIKGYCYGTGTRLVKMYILYLNGDWRGTGPEYKGYIIEFSQLELEESWDMLLAHARGKGWLPCLTR